MNLEEFMPQFPYDEVYSTDITFHSVNKAFKSFCFARTILSLM